MESLISLGKRIYNIKNHREIHRMLVFVVRAKLHLKEIRCLYDFFQSTEERSNLINENPFPMEQVTRSFFYKGSNFSERSKLIREHYAYLEMVLADGWMKKISVTDSPYEIWRHQGGGVNWSAKLNFNGGQRKEGLLSITMFFNCQPLYQVIFWIAKNKRKEYSLWIGAMQGPSGVNASELIKETTKIAYRYRTKNLILYMSMAVARSFSVKHLYAVSNKGYYAMNHVRRDRKLKTNFGEFWTEIGGHETEDPRFYELPLIEHRKTMDEVPTRKRAVYRKRFAFQDDVDKQIAEKMENILR